MKVPAYMHRGWLQLATSLRTSSAVIRPVSGRSGRASAVAEIGSPTLIRDTADDDALYVLMPMRV